MEVDQTPNKVARSMHDYWTLFLFEGAALVLLGLLAVVIPSIASSAATLFIGWLFIVSGVIGLVTTFLGATHTWILVVSRIRLARGSCRRRLSRAQI